MLNQEPVSSLKGVGEKTAKLFEKLGVRTVRDLLLYYPRAYDAYEAPVSAGELKENAVMAVRAVLSKPADLLRFNRMQMVSVSVKDLTGSVQLAWYNMPYMRNQLRPQTPYVFRGRVVKKRGRMVMEQPEVFTQEAYEALVPSMQPIYSQTRGLGNKAIIRAQQQALGIRSMEREYLPADIRRRYELAEINYAVEQIHFPGSTEELTAARKRLVFDEFFLFLTAVGQLKEKRGQLQSAYVMRPAEEVRRLKDNLPYKLTGAQERTWQEVQADLSGSLVMNRLIQGDVGSGKTIVAVLALLTAACNGFQGALMAPTEVLARQHFEAINRLLADHGIEKQAVLLTGSMTQKEKRQVYEQIRTHQADLIIGTHALIQERVEYDQLALVITDEQHRFGVGQRELFGAKGANPHVLVMSATPIPRTLAIILYGDLDISVIDQLPEGRKPIKNCVVGTDYRPKAYQFIARQVQEGHQAYVICPMVEESEMIQAENVLDYTRTLRKELPGVRVEFLHGKMKPRDKNQIMESFAAGEIQVLVSTTVVEVGVNVPNATVMMIENAERFGLAQLHQLRGRVGRGQAGSYCILINASEAEEAGRRLEILNQSNDGFFIAAEDLKLRGPGDLFGIRQSGDLEFKLADIFSDAKLLKEVSGEVHHLLQQDPTLEQEEHRELKRRLSDYLDENDKQLNL